MLDVMRKHSRSFLIYIFFGIIIFVFVFMFGPQSSGYSPTQSVDVAKIVGEDITNVHLNMEMSRVFNFSSPPRSLDDAGYISLQYQILEDLSMVYLISKYAEDAGFRVSDKMLLDFLVDPKRNSDFLKYSKDGKFAADRYERLAKSGYRVSVDEYESYKRREVLFRDYMSFLQQLIYVSNKEIRATFDERNTTVSLSYIKLTEKDVSEHISVSDEELSTYLTENEEKVKTFFEENKSRWDFKEEYELREIGIHKTKPPTEDAPPAEERYEAIRTRIFDDDEDFATVAGEVSESRAAPKSKQGHWGKHETAYFPPDRIEVVKGKEEGTIVEFENEVYYSLILLESYTAAHVEPYEEVKLEIAKEILTEERLNSFAQETYDKMKDRLIDGQDFQEVVDDVLGVAEVVEPPAEPVKTEAPVDPTKTEIPTDLAKAETIKTEVVTDPVKTDTPVEMAKVEEPTETDPLKVKEEVPVTPEIPEVKTEAKVEIKEPPKKISAIRVRTTSDFPMGRQSPFGNKEGRIVWEMIPGIGLSQELMIDAFALTEEKRVAEKVYEVAGSNYIVMLKEIKYPTDEEYEKGKKAIEQELVRKKQMDYLGLWDIQYFGNYSGKDYLMKMAEQGIVPKGRGLWMDHQWEQARENSEFEVDIAYFTQETEQ